MLLVVNSGVAGVVKMLSGVFIVVCILVSIYSTQALVTDYIDDRWDIYKPNITCPHDINVRIGAAQSYNPVNWTDPYVMGNFDDMFSVNGYCTPSSGSSFEVGITKVTCYATNGIGMESCSFLVDIDNSPLLTYEQANKLDIVSRELDLLSCQELQERVYTTTESPIQLSYDQMDELRNVYPEYFKADTGGEATEIVQQCNPKKRSAQVNVCSSSIVKTKFQMALDNNGVQTFVPQLGRFKLQQEFPENLCTGSRCMANLKCNCKNQTTHTGRAVVSYMKKTELKFTVIDIQLRSCVGYI